MTDRILSTDYILDEVFNSFVQKYKLIYTDSVFCVTNDIYKLLILKLKGVERPLISNYHYQAYDEYTYSQINQLLNTMTFPKYIFSVMFTYYMEDNYKRFMGYQIYWDELFTILVHFIQKLYLNGENK